MLFPFGRRAVRVFYVVLMLGLMSVGTVDMLTRKLPDPPLSGYFPPVVAPVLSFGAVWKEAFQNAAVDWYQRNWGARGIAVVADNTINFALFDETRVGHKVVVVDHDVLIYNEDIDYLNRVVDPAVTRRDAEQIESVQQRLLRRKILLLPLIVPSKTDFYADAIPSRWRRPGKAGETEATLYRTLVDTLEQQHTMFVDAHALLKQGAPPADDIFARTGRHWRPSAACRGLAAVVDTARPILDLGDDKVDCHTSPGPITLPSGEKDIFVLLNLWSRFNDAEDVHGETYDGRPARALETPTLIVGTSFEENIMRSATALRVFPGTMLYYYNARRIVVDTREDLGEVQPNTPAWRKEVFSRRLIIVELFESFMPGQGRAFLEQVARELDAEEQGTGNGG